MVVSGGGAVSYERGTPVSSTLLTRGIQGVEFGVCEEGFRIQGRSTLAQVGERGAILHPIEHTSCPQLLTTQQPPVTSKRVHLNDYGANLVNR